MQPLMDSEIILRLSKDTSADPSREWLRTLHFDLLHFNSQEAIGKVELRLGYALNVVRYGGHFGYEIVEKWRGHHYAAKACKILKSVAISHGMDVLWITCNPDNWPSRRTCEWIGAALVEIVDLPVENDQYLREC